MNDTLAERGARYGAFINHAEIAQGIQAVFHKMPNWPTLDYDMRQALCVIADKIARIGNGDPYYGDNWHDIQGYAKLVEDRINSIPVAENQLFEAVDEAIMPELKIEDVQAYLNLKVDEEPIVSDMSLPTTPVSPTVTIYEDAPQWWPDDPR